MNYHHKQEHAVTLLLLGSKVQVYRSFVSASVKIPLFSLVVYILLNTLRKHQNITLTENFLAVSILFKTVFWKILKHQSRTANTPESIENSWGKYLASPPPLSPLPFRLLNLYWVNFWILLLFVLFACFM